MAGTDPAVATVRAALDGYLPSGGRAVLALSGGPDSTALCLLVRRARPDAQLVAVHVRHGLRDDAPDARAAADIARRLGLPFDERRAVIHAGAGPEDAARVARYEVLLAAARAHRATAVLVGHSADDQAETVLLRLARGAGTRGLAGMAPARTLDAPVPDADGNGAILLLRPLLDLRRAHLHRLVADAGLPAVTDPTNADLSLRRNRVRAQLLPALEALAGAAGGERDPVPLLCRSARHARVDADALDALAAQVVARELQRWGPGAALRCAVLEELPEALGDRVLRALLAPACGGTPSAAAVATVRRLLQQGAGTCQVAGAAGGVRVSVGAGRVAAAPLAAGIAARALAAPDDAAAEVAVGIPELGLRLRLGTPTALRTGARGASVMPPGVENRPGSPAWDPLHGVPADRPATLVLRAPLPGDVLSGADGTRGRRLARRLAAVPRALRPLVPVLADSTAPGTVRWAAGVRAAARPGATRSGATRSGATPAHRAVRLETLG